MAANQLLSCQNGGKSAVVKMAANQQLACQNGGRGRRISYKSGGKSADVISIWLAGKLILFLSKMAILQSADL